MVGTVLALFTAVGIGGILGAYFRTHFQHLRSVKEEEHEMKRKRYGAILILMLTKLDPKTGLPHVRDIRPDLKELEDIEQEIKTELFNAVLFASDDVIRSMSEFVRNPSYGTYVKTAARMRMDLWNKKTSIDDQMLSVFETRIKNESDFHI